MPDPRHDKNETSILSGFAKQHQNVGFSERASFANKLYNLQMCTRIPRLVVLLKTLPNLFGKGIIEPRVVGAGAPIGVPSIRLAAFTITILPFGLLQFNRIFNVNETRWLPPVAQ